VDLSEHACLSTPGLSPAHPLAFSTFRYALSVNGGSQFVEMTGNSFTDLSGGFLKLGSVDGADFGGSNNSDR
jgi:hypothetical protein